MKKFMLLNLSLMLAISCLCNAQTTKKEIKGNVTAKVEAYYFHLSTRCITCKTVEAEARKDLESLYGDQVTFQSVNIEDDASKALIDKLQISGQTLLLVKGGTKINITNEGFMYARNNPEKFKSIIREKVDGLLKL
jgi:hypothetical protein